MSQAWNATGGERTLGGLLGGFRDFSGDRQSGRAHRRGLGAALALSVAFAITPAFAQTPAHKDESADDRKAAAKSFAEGQKAFKDGDFRHAAEAFELAYKQAPRLAPLWNCARAWHRAGEPVKAANLYARYLNDAPPSAPDRASALAAMKELEPKLARIEIHADGFTDVKLDGDPTDERRMYVTPGAHVVTGTKDGEAATERFNADAGGTLSVALVATPKEAPPPPPPPAPPPAPKEEPSHGLPPLVTEVGGALVLVGAGVTTWSGLDTRSQKATFLATPTQANLDAGHSKETRTNILLAVTGGVAVATVVVAVFFTDWGGAPKSAEVTLSPNGVALRGSF